MRSNETLHVISQLLDVVEYVFRSGNVRVFHVVLDVFLFDEEFEVSREVFLYIAKPAINCFKRDFPLK